MKDALKKIIAAALIFVVVFIVFPQKQAEASQVFKQGSSGAQATFASTVTSTAFASPLTNGSIIIVAFEADLQTTRANTPTDTAGNVYTLATSSATDHLGIDFEVWTAQNSHTTASDAVTVSDNGGGVRSAVIVQEFTGQATSNAVDKKSQNDPGSTGTAITSGTTGTLSQANEEIICIGLNNLNSNSLSLAGSYTNLTQTHQASPTGIGMSSLSVSSTAGVNCTMTTASAVWTGLAVTIKDAAAVVATPTEINTLMGGTVSHRGGTMTSL